MGAQKRGKLRNIQRYFCKNCKSYFSSKRRNNNEKLWEQYSIGKQTQEQIGKNIGKSRKWVNKRLKITKDLECKNTAIKPQETVLIIDTTYFASFGLMVFRSNELKRNLLWYNVLHETNEAYRKGIQELINDGWIIRAIVADGKPGLSKLFPHIPFQLCQFHQFQIVTRYISKKPKLEASRELREIMFFLKETDIASFEYWITCWHDKWREFLNEKTYNPITNKWTFTHQKLRKAYLSIKRNMTLLFTFEEYFNEFVIPNTTNSLDGYFSHLKAKLSVHKGASKETQLKLISNLIFS